MDHHITPALTILMWVQRSEANTRRYYDWRATADYYEPPPKLKAARPTARGDAPGRPQGSAPANVAPSWGFDARGPSNIPAVPPAASAAEPAAAGKAGLRTAPAVVPALQLPRREAEGQLPHVAAPVMPEPQQHLSPVRARSPAALRENPCVDGEPYQPGSPTRHILGMPHPMPNIPGGRPAAVSSACVLLSASSIGRMMRQKSSRIGADV